MHKILIPLRTPTLRSESTLHLKSSVMTRTSHHYLLCTSVPSPLQNGNTYAQFPCSWHLFRTFQNVDNKFLQNERFYDYKLNQRTHVTVCETNDAGLHGSL